MKLPTASITVPHAASRRRRRLLTGLAVALSVATLGACSNDTPADPVKIGTVEVTPHVTNARVGATQQLVAVVKDPSGVVMPSETVKWSAAEPTIATVSPSGLVTFITPGATAIIANARGYTGFASILSDANVATVRLSTAATANLPSGQTALVVATPLDAAGNALSRLVTWTSSTPTVATVSASGLVTSVSAGSTTVTGTSEGKSASTTFTIVPPPPVATVSVTQTGGFLPTLINVPLVAVVRDANNGLLTDRLVTWTTSDAPIATISATGVVSPSQVGTVTLTATSEGKSGSATFNVLTGLKSGTGIVFSNPLGSTAGTFAATTQFNGGGKRAEARQSRGMVRERLYFERAVQVGAQAFVETKSAGVVGQK